MSYLTERLKAAAMWHKSQNDHFQDSELLADAAKKIADLESAYRWIPTSEQMPEPQVNVFTRQANGQVGVVAWWGKDYSFHVTHWMPLPDPPANF